MLALDVCNLSVALGASRVVSDVSLQVGRGEAVAFLGPNGAGKTSLIRGVSGEIPVTSGTVSYLDRDLAGRPMEERASRGMVVVPQGRRLFQNLTVHENLLMGHYVGTSLEKRAADGVLERALELFPEMSEFTERRAGALSGGQQQMVAIARACAASPSLLILDEPSLGLAPTIVDRIYATFATLKAHGTSILIVEQLVSRAMELCDRAYFISHGEIVSELDGADRENVAAAVELAYFGGHNA